MTATAVNNNRSREVRVLSVEQFHKTKMCPHMNKPEGCIRSVRSQCPYAHTEAELKDPPNLLKTAMCKLHLKNSCKKSSDECPYAHDFDELRHTEGFYKTFVCKFWQKGHCKAGDMCRYAHGVQEIRKSSQQSTYDQKHDRSVLKVSSTFKAIENMEGPRQTVANDKECNTPTLSSGYCYNHTTRTPMYLYPMYGEMNPFSHTPTPADMQQWLAAPEPMHTKEQEEAYCLMHYYLQKYIECCSKQQIIVRQHVYFNPAYNAENCYKN